MTRNLNHDCLLRVSAPQHYNLTQCQCMHYVTRTDRDWAAWCENQLVIDGFMMTSLTAQPAQAVWAPL
jgi:hypothetical protein